MRSTCTAESVGLVRKSVDIRHVSHEYCNINISEKSVAKIPVIDPAHKGVSCRMPEIKVWGFGSNQFLPLTNCKHSEILCTLIRSILGLQMLI